MTASHVYDTMDRAPRPLHAPNVSVPTILYGTAETVGLAGSAKFKATLKGQKHANIILKIIIYEPLAGETMCCQISATASLNMIIPPTTLGNNAYSIRRH